MAYRFKALLISLLVMVVPLQGIAAVSAGICRALEHHDIAGPLVVDHAAAHGYQGDLGSGSANHDKGAGGSEDRSTAASGHCTPCGAAATITGTAIVFVPQAPLGEESTHEPESFGGIDLGGLDRPPLTLPV